MALQIPEEHLPAIGKILKLSDIVRHDNGRGVGDG
jgi:hypothetical protein